MSKPLNERLQYFLDYNGMGLTEDEIETIKSVITALSPVLPGEVERAVSQNQLTAMDLRRLGKRGAGKQLDDNADLIERLAGENAIAVRTINSMAKENHELQARIDDLETWINENYPEAFVEPGELKDE